MRYILILLLLLGSLFVPKMEAQIPPNSTYVYTYVGTALPALCNNGDLFHNVSTYSWFQCGPVNTWNVFGGGGGGGGATIPATTNFINGDGAGNGANSGVAVSGAGIVGLFSGGASGYLGTDAARHALPVIPTIASTTNVLVGNGSGGAISATGTAANCIHVDGGNSGCSGSGYTAPVSNLTTLTVTKGTHGQGNIVIPACLDNTTTTVFCSATVNTTNGTVVFSWPMDSPFTGSVIIK